MYTGGTECDTTSGERVEMSLAQICIIIGEINDRVKVDFGDREVGRFKSIIANFDTFLLGPLNLC